MKTGRGTRGLPGIGHGRWPVKYRDMKNIDLGVARRAICAWLDYQGGTLAQMADELKHRCPDHPKQVAVALRGMIAAELRQRTQPGTAFSAA